MELGPMLRRCIARRAGKLPNSASMSFGECAGWPRKLFQGCGKGNRSNSFLRKFRRCGSRGNWRGS